MAPIGILAKRILIALVVVVPIVYVCDFVSVRIRMMHAKPSDPFETITSLRILAIDEKGNKTEYSVDPVQPQQTGVCVHALFPHSGDWPCWYLKRKFAQPIPMTILPFARLADNREEFTNLCAARFCKSPWPSSTRGARQP